MKIYHVFLNKNVSVADMEAIKEGVDLEPQVAEDGTEKLGREIKEFMTKLSSMGLTSPWA